MIYSTNEFDWDEKNSCFKSNFRSLKGQEPDHTTALALLCTDSQIVLVSENTEESKIFQYAGKDLASNSFVFWNSELKVAVRIGCY